jgi:hypothetical protein
MTLANSQPVMTRRTEEEESKVEVQKSEEFIEPYRKYRYYKRELLE